MNTFFSFTFTLFLVIDALGIIPTYVSLLKPFDKKKQRLIALRELLIALFIMILFHFVGQFLLFALHVSYTTVQISGGIILFLIAIRLIFGQEEEKSKWVEKELVVFPIATPLIAGPTVFATIMIFSLDERCCTMIVFGAISLAWFISSLILFFANPIYHVLKDKGLLACQRLMGLIVAIIAVQLFIGGVERLISK